MKLLFVFFNQQKKKGINKVQQDSYHNTDDGLFILFTLRNLKNSAEEDGKRGENQNHQIFEYVKKFCFHERFSNLQQ